MMRLSLFELPLVSRHRSWCGLIRNTAGAFLLTSPRLSSRAAVHRLSVSCILLARTARSHSAHVIPGASAASISAQMSLPQNQQAQALLQQMLMQQQATPLLQQQQQQQQQEEQKHNAEDSSK